MRLIVSLLFSFILSFSLLAQDPLRFEQEVKTLIEADSLIDNTHLILFTGSSSIRMWQDLKSDFPLHPVLNRGFGGSEMTDLLYYVEPLILAYKPDKIFIYEGDNDINSGKSTEAILKTAEQLLAKIRESLPSAEIIFISPKPSIARWHLKAEYEEFNSALKLWVANQEDVQFADVWTPMFDASGKVMDDIFLSDNLHLNKKGYAIWTKVIKEFIEE